MTIQILGAGFGRTGTKSLKLALEHLGFGLCYHMSELHENLERLVYWQQAMETGTTDWDALFEGYRSCVDWPGAFYWRELAAVYPEAKIILTVRPVDAWVKSIRSTIFPALTSVAEMPPGLARDRRGMTLEIIANRTFDNRLDDEPYLTDRFFRHVEDVRKFFPAERLLIYDVAEGWGPLCPFLGVDVPAEDFPFTNTTREFQERARERARALAEDAKR